ncbi:MAG: lysylphosphatidylglycerol synthase transmembrane domain-containing protein [Candidatus Cryptobacteroides sp.]|nr:lysylphosphatidylglycerol synthase transmembrane domain-containing protein [Candidatus Cryptobacteroides sp.]
MKAESKKILKIALSFALAGVFVFFAFRGIDWASFAQDIRQTRWIWVLAFCVVSVGALIFRMLRWQALLRPLHGGADAAESGSGGSAADGAGGAGGKVSALRVWDANNVGNIVNVVIPGSGEFVRCGYMTAGRASYDKVLGTVVTERICDVLAIVLLMAIAILCGSEQMKQFFRTNIAGAAAGKLSLLWVLAGVLLLLAAGVWALWHFRERNAFCGKIADKLKGFAGGMTSFVRMRKKWLFIIYTIGIWTMYVLMSYSIIKAMPELSHLGAADALFLCAIGNFASVIPVPGGIGAYHYLVALSLSGIYGVSWETGLLNATLNHELHAILILLLGAVSYVSLTLQSRKAAKKAM